MSLSIRRERAEGDEKRVVITLSGVAAICESRKIKGVLIDALAECGELLLDVGAVTNADSSLLQLIHAARCTAVNAGIKFELAGEASAAFHEAAISAGFLAEGDSTGKSIQLF